MTHVGQKISTKNSSTFYVPNKMFLSRTFQFFCPFCAAVKNETALIFLPPKISRLFLVAASWKLNNFSSARRRGLMRLFLKMHVNWLKIALMLVFESVCAAQKWNKFGKCVRKGEIRSGNAVEGRDCANYWAVFMYTRCIRLILRITQIQKCYILKYC